jgi:hypothetical protein
MHTELITVRKRKGKRTGRQADLINLSQDIFHGNENYGAVKGKIS